MFIGQHGSWNRVPYSDYKVVFVRFDDAGVPAGPPRDVLTGFIDGAGNAAGRPVGVVVDAAGRPVGVVVDNAGGLLVADDVGNIVWRVSEATP